MRLVYKDRQSAIEINQRSVHHKNLQILAIEMYKVKHGIASDIMNDIFRKRKTSGSTRNPFSFETRNIKTVYHGSETVAYLASKIRKLAPPMTKDTENINFFESNMKLWKPENYPSRL